MLNVWSRALLRQGSRCTASGTRMVAAGVLGTRGACSGSTDCRLALQLQGDRLVRTFVKKGKKEIEKEEKQRAKAEADIPDQIDLPAIEALFKDVVNKVSDKLKKMKFGVLDVETLSAIEVEAYGETSSLGDLAQVIIKNDTTAQITVYDPDVLNNARKSLESSSFNFNIKPEGTSLLVSLIGATNDRVCGKCDHKYRISVIPPNSMCIVDIGANTKKAREEFVKEIRAVGAKETERLRNIRAEQMTGIKKWKDLLPKDVSFNAEKQIHEFYTAQSKALTDAVNAKVKAVESGN